MEKIATAINRNQVTEEEIHKFSAEASELGLVPGEWPDRILVAPDIGNGLFFFKLAGMFSTAGDFGGFVYKQTGGCVLLKIFND